MDKADFSKYEYSAHLPDAALRAEAARAMGMAGFGPELDGYLRDYGYLADGGIELLGVTGNQGLRSDMVLTTAAVTEHAPWLRGYAVLYKPTDDDCIAVDGADRVYAACLLCDVIMPLDMGLHEYIGKLFRNELS